MEQSTPQVEKKPPTTPTPPPPPSSSNLLLLILNSALMLTGIGGSLLLRLYFTRGGRRMWLSTFIQVGGWPLLLIPISLFSLLHRPRRRPLLLLPPRIYAAASLLGLLFALNCYLYSYGTSYLPLSTSSLLISTQLTFTALFAFLIVRQRFTAYSINSIVLLTVGPVLLGFSASKDRPAGESDEKYYLGFFMTIAASMLLGLYMPLTERMYRTLKDGAVSYGIVMEVQLVMAVAASAFCLVGMIVNKDFQAIPREAREFELGEMKYYMVLVGCAIFWQLSNLALVGVLMFSSLLAGVLITVILPITEISAVFVFHEKFDGNKGVALALCFWGLASYSYGEMKQNRKLKKLNEVELQTNLP